MPVSWQILLFLCVMAVAVNWRGHRSRYAALTFFVLLFGLSPFLPTPSELGRSWYLMCAGIELSLAIALWLLSGAAARYLLGIGLAAVAIHVATYYRLIQKETYSDVIVVVEYLQALALILFSHPVANLAIYLIFRVDLDNLGDDTWTART